MNRDQVRELLARVQRGEIDSIEGRRRRHRALQEDRRRQGGSGLDHPDEGIPAAGRLPTAGEAQLTITWTRSMGVNPRRGLVEGGKGDRRGEGPDLTGHDGRVEDLVDTPEKGAPGAAVHGVEGLTLTTSIDR